MKHALIIWLLLPGLVTKAQQAKLVKSNQLWNGYFQSAKISARFSLNSDVQARTVNFYEKWSQLIARTGVSYKASENVNFSAGLVYAFSFQDNKVAAQEFRPWQEFGVNHSHSRLNLTHRFRTEQRYFSIDGGNELGSQHFLRHRFRYKIDLQYKVWQAADSVRSIKIQLGNEILITAGQYNGGSYVDHNRSWAGVFFTLGKKLTLHAQYLNILQPAGAQAINHIRVVRFNLYHTFSLS